MELNCERQNMKSNNNLVAGNDNTIDCLLDEISEKYLQVELIKELVDKGETNLRKREEYLKDKLRKLDNLHNRIFQMENDLCESIWKFTADHDFASVINQILDDKVPNYEENDQIQFDKIYSAKNDVQKIICDTSDVIMNIDKALIDVNRKLVAEVNKQLDDNSYKKIKNETVENLTTPKEEPDFKVPVKLKTSECHNVKFSKKFSVKKKSSICKKFEMSS